MKKSFLLLLWMALLPLAGWAGDVFEVDVTPVNKSLTWNNKAPNDYGMFQGSWIRVKKDGQTITNADIKAAIAGILDVQIVGDGDGVGVGEYTYKLKLANNNVGSVFVGTNDDEYIVVLDNTTATLTIDQYTEVPVFAVNQLKYVDDDLTYSGQPQTLLTLGAAVSPSTVQAEAQAATATANGVNVPVVYALSSDAETWTADYTTLKGTNAGTYTVYYKVAGTDNYVGSEPIAFGEGKVIKKATVSFTNTVSAAAVYTGADQSLLTVTDPSKPAVNFGASTLVYKVWTGGMEPEQWTAIPETGIAAITGKNVGTYNVRLRVPASDNWYDGDDGAGGDHASTILYTVGISRALIDEEKVSAALATPAETFTFNNAEHTPALTVSYDDAPLTVDDGDIAIAYADNINASTEQSLAKATVTFNNYYLGDDPDEAYTKDVTFTIAPKSLGVDGVAADGITTRLANTATPWVYDGTAKSYGGGLTRVVYNVDENTTLTLSRTTDYDRSYAGDFVNATASVDEANKPYYLFTGKGNYTGTVKLYVTIAKAELTATVKSQTIDFGAALPDNEIDETTIVGLQGTDVFATAVGDITYTYKQGDEVVETPSAVGGYSIEATATPANYNVTFAPGTLTIGNATAVIVPIAKSKLYGAADPTLAWKVEDAQGNALDNSVLGGTVTLARQQGEDVNTYLIYVVSYVPSANDSYTVDQTKFGENGKTAPFTIFANTENTLVLKFKDDLDDAKKTKVYDGTKDVTFTADDFEAVSGLLNGDTWPIAGATIAAELSSADVAEGITATATITGLANYSAVEVQASLPFTITKRAITITANDQIIAQGGALDQSGYVVSDNVTLYGDTEADLNIVLSTTKTAVGGPYTDAITVSATNANYDFSYVPGALTITGADPAVGIILGDVNTLQTIKDYAGMSPKITVKIYRNNVMNAGQANEKTYSWKRAQWNPMVLPFDVTVRELSAKIGYAIVNTYDQDNTTESNAAFKLTMGTIPANTPFLLKTDEDKADGFELVFNDGDVADKVIVAPTDATMKLTAANGISYNGTYENVDINSGNSLVGPDYLKYYADNQIKYIGTSSTNTYTVYPFGCYFGWTAPVGSRAMTITVEDVDGTKTSIRSIDSEDASTADGWYNLNGMKMNGAPAQKGIYIKDGKKVVVK